jgi:splicing factor 3B subunit 5
MTKFEFAVNMHRDTIASNVGHSDILSFFSVAQNESIGRTRHTLLEKMVQPCGPPPVKKDDKMDTSA